MTAQLRFKDFAFDVLPEQFDSNHKQVEEVRLIVVDAKQETIAFDKFSNITNYFDSQDVLAWNNVGISPSRLLGKAGSGESIDVCFLFKQEESQTWEVVVLCEEGYPETGSFELAEGKISGKFLGKTLDFDGAYWIEKNRYCGYRGLVQIDQSDDQLRQLINQTGKYMHPWYTNLNELPESDLNPVIAKRGGSVLIAEPSRRFTKNILAQLQQKGTEFIDVSLEMSFSWQPSQPEMLLSDYHMNSEAFEVSEQDVNTLKSALKNKKRIISIGTSGVRVLESLPVPPVPLQGKTDIFISPGVEFKYCDAMLTNLHVSMSTHVIMTCAFGGTELVIEACKQAVQKGYRFGIHGDAILVLGKHRKLADDLYG
jgi:S-adenosylmethionine:tRNA ribosyltransferase-isomerase